VSSTGPIIVESGAWRRWLAALGIVSVVVLAVVGVRVLPGLLSPCPSSARAGIGDAGVERQGALVGHLPQAIPRFTTEYPQAVTELRTEHGQDLRDAGFLYGYFQTYEQSGILIEVTVHQFATPARAEAFESAQTKRLCAGSHHAVKVRGVVGASAISVASATGTTYRVGFIRGSRSYVIDVNGPSAPRTLPGEAARAIDALAS
jgi:hypothetical protein